MELISLDYQSGNDRLVKVTINSKVHMQEYMEMNVIKWKEQVFQN